VANFKNSLDSTLIIAKQIAEALDLVHKKGIIHRDVKPENILFKGDGTDCLLADFGICLVMGQERGTNTGEVVGPRHFIAPEIEGGGVIEDVDASVDIYSLGKIIYYIFSGGKTFPRERMRENEYDIFSQESGGRLQKLGYVLDKMICERKKRINDMADVINEINLLQAWDKADAKIAVSSSENIERILQVHFEKEKKESVSARNHEKYNQMNKEFFTDCNNWLWSYLMDYTQKLMGRYPIDLSREDFSSKYAPDEVILQSITETHVLNSAYGLFFRNDGIEFRLVFKICSLLNNYHFKEFRRTGNFSSISPRFSMLPFYSGGRDWEGYFNIEKKWIPVNRSFEGKKKNLYFEDDVTNWPSNKNALEDTVNNALNLFWEYNNLESRSKYYR